LREINTRFDAPHSRYNDISREQFEAAGLTVLAESETGGVHLAISPDQFRVIYFQGHPEYDYNSLLKEYKREVMRYLRGDLDAPPPFPAHYFSRRARLIAADYIDSAKNSLQRGEPLPDFDEQLFEPLLDNTWGDTAKAIVNNWLGLVYQTTNLDRKKQFMDDIDPKDPLGIHARNQP
jgi:homoserine O-succinyltransferase